MSASQRMKGKRGELEVVAILHRHGWTAAERSSRGTAQAAGDVINGPEAVHLEIRRREALSVPAAMREILGAAAATDLPVLAHRPSRSPWLATLELEELLPLLWLRGHA